MQNQQFTGTPTSRRFCPCPSTVKSGDAVLVGTMPAVALDNYQSNEGGTTFLFGGAFVLTVVGQNAGGNHQIKVGDALFASGSLDSTTNVTTGLTIDANASHTPFGNLDPESPGVGSGVTVTTAIVNLPNGM